MAVKSKDKDSTEDVPHRPYAKLATPLKPTATGLAENIVYYCKDCREIVPVQRVGTRYVYACTLCGTKNVAFGTRKSIAGFFRIKPTEEMVEDSDVPIVPAVPVEKGADGEEGESAEESA